jgi:Fic family protein
MKLQGSPVSHKSFVPNPLPPQLQWDDGLVNSLSQADHVLGMLAREGSRLPNPHLLIRPFIAREAVLSSRIEGTQATLGEVLAREAGAAVSRNLEDLQEVHNYIIALDHGLSRLPLSLRFIREMHGKLMQQVRGAHATPGEFRQVQNWIGAAGCTLGSAKFVPPAPHQLGECLEQLEKFLPNKKLPPLIHVALCHYQFEAIHPFLDGNGRMGRLLITLLMIERKLLPSPLLYLSGFFEATRDDYYRHLDSVSKKGTWNDWLSYFLRGVAVQALDALSRAERINALIVDWKIQLGASQGSAVQEVVSHLAVNPYFTIKKLAQSLGVAFTTAQRAVRRLEALGVASQVTQGKRDRVYCARRSCAS